MITPRVPLAALLVGAALVLPAALHAQQADEAVVPVTGEARIRGDSLLAANTAAKNAAYRQALRMQQVTRLGRAYRLRAVAMKLWRAMLVLEVIQRLTGWSPEKRLKRLEELLRAKEEEIADLRGEIDRLRSEIEHRKAAIPVGDATTPAAASVTPPSGG